MATMRAPSAPAGVDRYAVVHGLRFHYREAGDRDAPVAMMLHGLMGHAREWDTLTTALARRFRTLALDQRGHGETDWTAAYTAAAMASDITELAQRLKIPRLRLVGHSMGAMAAALVAADHPGLVERLVLIDAGPDSLTGDWARRELPAMLRALREASYRDAGEAVHEWVAGDPLAREALVRHYVEHNLVPRADGRLTWRFDAAGLVGFATGGVTEDELWHAVDRIVAPTLLIRGRHSELLSRATAARMTQRLADPAYTEIPDAGHDLASQQPEAVTTAVLSFLRAQA
jgi:esterase